MSRGIVDECTGPKRVGVVAGRVVGLITNVVAVVHVITRRIRSFLNGSVQLLGLAGEVRYVVAPFQSIACRVRPRSNVFTQAEMRTMGRGTGATDVS